jgi:ATP dependent DNA ligase domain
MLQRTLPAGFIAPCLPSKTDKLPSGGQWLHEIKHDGFRVIAQKSGAQVRLYGRPGNDLTYRFPLIVETLVAAMVQARDAVEHRSWSHPQEATGEEWWADVLADPRARKREWRTDLAVKRAYYRLADEKARDHTCRVQQVRLAGRVCARRTHRRL